MSNANPIELPKTSVKQSLDRAELVERVPALQRKFTRVKFGERGEMIQIFPRHHLVSAYGCELATANARRECDVADLKVARRRFKNARVNYEDRVAFRMQPNIAWPDGGKFVSLSAILEARAEAVFWRKVVKEMEYVETIKQHNKVAIELAAGIVRHHPRRRPQMRSV
jgi:hypothetical protein